MKILSLIFLLSTVVVARDFSELSLQEFKAELSKSNDRIIYAVLAPKPAGQKYICRTLSYSDYEDHFDIYLPKDKSELITLYGSGIDDLLVEEAALKISGMGYSNIKIFYGGISAWVAAGGRLPK